LAVQEVLVRPANAELREQRDSPDRQVPQETRASAVKTVSREPPVSVVRPAQVAHKVHKVQGACQEPPGPPEVSVPLDSQAKQEITAVRAIVDRMETSEQAGDRALLGLRVSRDQPDQAETLEAVETPG